MKLVRVQAFAISAGTIVLANWFTAMTLVPYMFSFWAEGSASYTCMLNEYGVCMSTRA